MITCAFESDDTPETSQRVGIEWCLPGDNYAKWCATNGEGITMLTSFGLLVLCHVEVFQCGVNGGIRRVPVKPSDLNTVRL